MRLRRALPPIGYLVLSVAWSWALWVDPAHRLPPNPPDVALFTWWLEWAAHPAVSLHADALNAPLGVNAMWQTAMLLPGMAVAPLTRLAGAQVSYNVMLTLGPALSAIAGWTVLRRVVRSEAGAVLGGALYGFSPAIMAEAYGGHLQLTLAALPPILLYLLWRGHGSALGLLAAAQLLIGEELLAATALAGVLLLLLHRPPALLRTILVATVTGAPLAAWPLAVQFLGSGRVSGNVQAPGHFREDLAAYVVPSRLLLLHGPAPIWPTGLQEVTGYLGVPLVAVCVITVLRGGTRARAAGAVGAALGVLALGADLVAAGHRTRLPLPFAVLEGIPVLGNLLPSRLPILTAGAVALLLALAVERWGRRMTALAVLGLVPMIPRPLPAVTVAPTPGYFAASPRGTLLVLPFPTPTETAPMRWQTESGLSFAMPGGFFVGPDSRGRAGFGPQPTPTSRLLARVERTGAAPPIGEPERAAWQRDLRYWKADGVVLGPAKCEAALRDTVTALAGRPPQRRNGVDWWPL